MRSYESVGGDLAALTAARIGATLLGLVNILVITTLFTPEEYGRYSLFQMMVNVGLTFGVFWSSVSIIRFGREELEKSGAMGATFWGRLLLLGTSAALFAGAGYALRRPIASYTGLPPFLFPFFLATFLFVAMLDHYQRALQAVRRMGSYALSYLVQIGTLTFGVLLIATGLLPTTLPVLLGVFTLSNGAGFLFAAARFPPKAASPARIDGRKIAAIVRFSLPQLFGFGGIYIVNWVDIAVIREMLGTEDVGVYQLAYRFFAALIALSMVAATVLAPLMVSLRTKGEESLVRRYAADMVPLVTLLFGIALLAAGSAARLALPAILPDAYLPALPCLLVLLAAALFRTLSLILVPALNAYDKVIDVQAVNVGVAAINIVLDIVLVPRFHILGAAMATSIAYAAGTAVLILRMRPIARTGERKLVLALLPAAAGIVAVATIARPLPAFAAAAGAAAILLTLGRTGRYVNGAMYLLVERISMPRSARSAAVALLDFIGAKRTDNR